MQNVVRDLENEAAFRRTYGEAVRGSNTANKTLGAEAVDVRTPSAAGSTSDISLAGMGGGLPGMAGAVGVRGAKYGLGFLGRRSDIARNDQLAEGLTRQGPELQMLIDAVRGRSERMQGMDQDARTKARAIAEILLNSGERNSDNIDRLDSARRAAMVQMIRASP